MPSLNVYNTSAKKTSTLSVSKQIFAVKVNQTLIAQAVKVYLANQRQAPAQTKSRGEIVASKKKIWRQKGTGRARHGSRNAPVFVGGAKAHGPTGQQNYQLKMPQKMKQKALFSALTQQYNDQNIIIISGLDKLQPKTKLFDKLFKKFVKNPQKLLLLFDQPNPAVKKGTANLPYLQSLSSQTLNVYSVLNASKLIFTPESIKSLQKHYAV